MKSGVDCGSSAHVAVVGFDAVARPRGQDDESRQERGGRHGERHIPLQMILDCHCSPSLRAARCGGRSVIFCHSRDTRSCKCNAIATFCKALSRFFSAETSKKPLRNVHARAVYTFFLRRMAYWRRIPILNATVVLAGETLGSVRRITPSSPRTPRLLR